MTSPSLLAQISPCPGVWLCRTSDGIPVLQLRYWADPDKTAEWASKEQKKYTTDAFWKKEMLGDAHALEGQLVYPEFDPAVHVIPDSRVPKQGCRYMSIDPHPRTPHAMLWVLIDQFDDWFIYRELWPSLVYGQSRQVRDTDTEKSYTVRDYSEAIAWIEGNEIEWRNAETGEEYGVYRVKDKGERVLERYMDQAGKAFKASDEASLIETYARRYSRYGIDCRDPRKAHEAGEDALRELLATRTIDKGVVWPKLHVAASCTELILEFQRHRYKRTRGWTDEKDLKQQGIEARSHQLDNLRYLATADLSFIKSAVS